MPELLCVLVFLPELYRRLFINYSRPKVSEFLSFVPELSCLFVSFFYMNYHRLFINCSLSYLDYDDISGRKSDVCF